MNDFDWAAWLGDYRSPYFSPEFVENLIFDNAATALEQLAATLSETSFDDDIAELLSSGVE